jgi:hypothetical protein
LTGASGPARIRRVKPRGRPGLGGGGGMPRWAGVVRR